MDQRITVSARELAAAMTVWLRVMPTRIWRELEKYHLSAKDKRQGEKPDAERAVAEYLAGKFDQAEWEVTHGNIDNPLSDHHGRARHGMDRP